MIGVGLAGAGAVVQTVHLPTLARLTDLFTVRAVMDTDAETARKVAARVGSVATNSFQDLIEDARVELVAICSPPEFHAEQTVTALRAGKAVLCEKPLATTPDELREVERAVTETGGLLIVGAMHAFDPAWTGIRSRLDHLIEGVRTVRSSIVLPFNDRYETRAGQLLPREAMTLPDTSVPAVRAAMTSAAVLGLAVHDLPLVHELIGRREAEVVSAEFLDPFGYVIGLRAGETVIEVSGVMQPHWKPLWELDAHSGDQSLHVDFTPSFVHAGSASATLTSREGAFTVADRPTNGYEAEWRALADALNGSPEALPKIENVIADAGFVVRIAERATALISEQVPA